MNIRQIIEYQLSKPNHVVKVSSGDMRLSKASGALKFAYSKEEILKEFGSIDEFLSVLTKRGFTTTKFRFERIYGEPPKTTYHFMKEEIVNLTPQVQTPQNPQPITATPSFLASPNVGNGMEFLGAFVQAERAGDYKKRVGDLEEDVKDYRSKIRRLEDENHSLKLKLDTAEERAELKLQKELLERKGFFETDGAQKAIEGLAGVLPQLLPVMMNKGATPTQLGAPTENLTAMQSQAITLIKNSNDENSSFVVYLLQNMSSGLMDLLTNYIENNAD